MRPSERITSPRDFIAEYERMLSTHSWDKVEPLIHEAAVFIFTEGTFRGKEEASMAFTKTFTLIEDETYRIREVNWTAEGESVAACEYVFEWSGIVGGKETSGGGRGSSVLLKTEEGWQLVLEHLGMLPGSYE